MRQKPCSSRSSSNRKEMVQECCWPAMPTRTLVRQATQPALKPQLNRQSHWQQRQNVTPAVSHTHTRWELHNQHTTHDQCLPARLKSHHSCSSKSRRTATLQGPTPVGGRNTLGTLCTITAITAAASPLSLQQCTACTIASLLCGIMHVPPSYRLQQPQHRPAWHRCKHTAQASLEQGALLPAKK